MRIGEYLVDQKHIKQKDLDNALEMQANNKGMRVGELLVKSGAISEKDLNKYVFDFMNNHEEAEFGDASDWLNQEDVDNLFTQYKEAD